MTIRVVEFKLEWDGRISAYFQFISFCCIGSFQNFIYKAGSFEFDTGRRDIRTPGGEHERHKKEILPGCGNSWRGIVWNEQEAVRAVKWRRRRGIGTKQLFAGWHARR